MAEHANHHYVPQFYFKLFNGSRRDINSVLKKNGQVVIGAPIRSQSARHMFYGTVDIEKAFSQLEGRYAEALWTLVEVARTGDMSHWSQADHYPWLLQAIAFQRARTMLEVDKNAPAMGTMLKHTFSEHVRHTLPAEKAAEIIGAIERGEILITQSETDTVLRQIAAAMESASLLFDLQPRVLRNNTDYPFIFSDSPVVFYNAYYRKITDRGVLGFQTPGLQIFLPLPPKYQLMMFDAAMYEGACLNGPFCEVVDRSDVSELNALQLHHSRDAVYFDANDDAAYVKGLYESHKPSLGKPEAAFRVRRDVVVKGEAGHPEIMHNFEPQLPYNLSLSFIRCTPVEPRDFKFRHRHPEMVEKHDRIRRERGKGWGTMSDEKKIDIMVEAGIFTPEEAERAKQAAARARSSANPST